MRYALTSFLILGLAAMAQGAILWFPRQDIPIPTTFEGVSVDLETGNTSVLAAGLSGGDANFILGGGAVTNDADQTAGVPSWQPVRTGTSNVDPLRQLGIGDTVNSASTVATGFGASGDPNAHFPEFTPDTPGYVGFSLVLEDNTTAYGWMRVTLQENNQSGGLIHEWAIEDSGGAITVGVPEPSTSLLAILALGGIFLRRRR
ncbi:MAG: hypothetical protein CMP29_05795 [Roseibacillus sp.]|nr:hypothetical protein [Roseibacillus sp.]